MADHLLKFKASKTLIEARDKLHKSMSRLMTETKTSDDKAIIPKSGYYRSMYETAYAIKEAKGMNPDISSSKPFQDAIQTLKSIDEVISTKCKVEGDTLTCDKDSMRIIGDMSSPSLNLLANEIHDLGMSILAEVGGNYKNCVISPDIVAEKSLDGNMMAMCDGIMDWVKQKITPTVTSSTMEIEGIEMPAQRLDIKMNGHGHVFRTTMDAEGNTKFTMKYFDYAPGRVAMVNKIFRDLMAKHLAQGTPDTETDLKIESVEQNGNIIYIRGTIHKPEGARVLSRFLMGTKDADFVKTSTCKLKTMIQALNRAIELKDKDTITHAEEKSLISNIIACKTKCGYVHPGKTLAKWYKEEGC